VSNFRESASSGETFRKILFSLENQITEVFSIWNSWAIQFSCARTNQCPPLSLSSHAFPCEILQSTQHFYGIARTLRLKKPKAVLTVISAFEKLTSLTSKAVWAELRSISFCSFHTLSRPLTLTQFNITMPLSKIMIQDCHGNFATGCWPATAARSLFFLILWTTNSLLLFGRDSDQQAPPTKVLDGTIRIHGSGTMKPLLEAWSIEFMRLHPGVKFELRPEGSLLAVASLAEKIPAIGAMSRRLSDDEKTDLAAIGINEVLQIPVARDRIAIIAHPTNPIPSLTLAQLKKIFEQPRGDDRKWSQVGLSIKSQDDAIVLVGPNELSGTREAFASHVLGSIDLLAESIVSCDNQPAVVERVAEDPNAIGFVSLIWLSDSANVLAIANDDSSPALLPTIDLDSDQDAVYAMERELYLLIAKTDASRPSVAERAFIDYVLSDQGMTIVRRTRFLPLSDKRMRESSEQFKSFSLEK
jgi:phosphate transport system substrate-binding protein